MVGYRCYILDAEDHIVQAHNLDCDSDTQAQTEAGNFLARTRIIVMSKSGGQRAGSRSWNARLARSSPVPSGIATAPADHGFAALTGGL